MQKGLIEKLSLQNLDIKQFIDWNQAYQQEQLTLNLQELKSRLEAELSQSIESHVIRKQKHLQELSKGIQVIMDIKSKTAEAFELGQGLYQKDSSQNQIMNRKKSTESLENLVQLINLKNHVDYCLQKLEPILNSENANDNSDINEDED